MSIAQELHSFFGIAPYMSPFIPNLSVMPEPPRNLLKKGTDFHWSPFHSAAFEKIKQSICLQVSLTYFDPKRETVLLVHEEFKNVAFSSRALTDIEKRYANIEREIPCCCCCCLWEISLVLVWQSQITNLFSWFTSRILQLSRRPKALENVAQNTRILLHCLARKMPFARQISRPNPLPREESLDLRKVGLVQFLDEKFNALKQDTSSNPELQLYSGWPKNITKLQCWVSTGPTGMNRLLKTVWSSREKGSYFQNHEEMTS